MTSTATVRGRAEDFLADGSPWQRGLLVDVGSTFTKLTVLDRGGELVATARAATTVQHDVVDGLLAGLDALPSGGRPPFDWALATSSAAGGLRIASVGLTERLSGQAGVLASLGAGGRVVCSRAGFLDDAGVAAIAESAPHLIMLTGGVDGGNEDCLVHNARRLADAAGDVSVIVAGNTQAAGAAMAAFGRAQVTVIENVFPAPSVVRIDAARNAVRELFMNHIAQAKGLAGLARILQASCEPTPLAVSRAVGVLAAESHIASLALVDLGGATTDVHSAGGEQRRIRQVDLTLPPVLRTVEGDVGMRWGAPGAVDMVPDDERKLLENELEVDLDAEALFLRQNPSLLATSDRDRRVDDAIACASVATALERHSGHVVVRRQRWGDRHRVEGKDMRACDVVIATGGVFRADHVEAATVLDRALSRAGRTSLAPKSPRTVIDADYRVYAAGLVARADRHLAARVLRQLTTSIEEAS